MAIASETSRVSAGSTIRRDQRIERDRWRHVTARLNPIAASISGGRKGSQA
jgi:hypothetical protein